MAVRLNPCFGCFVKKTDNAACHQQYDRKRAQVANLGLQSATFACPVLAKELRVGRRIVISIPALEEGEWDARVFKFERDAKATISSARNGMFSCIVDAEEMNPDDWFFPDGIDPDKLRFRRTMCHTRIKRFLDEPDRAACELGSLQTPDGKCDRRKGEACGCSMMRDEAAYG